MKCNAIHWKRQAIAATAAALMSIGVDAGDDASALATKSPASERIASVEAHTLGAADSRIKAQESVNGLSKDIQDLKRSVITLNKNLRVLEEDMLFPANTQVTVFVSMDVGKFFSLESVKLEMDGKVVASHTYTDRELVALAKGGIHRLHMENLSVGEHRLSAFFTGVGPNGRQYKRGTTMKIAKKKGPKYVELKITDSTLKLQPQFTVAQW